MSISHGRTLDVGRIGLEHDDLPPFESGPIDLKRQWFGDADHAKPLDLEIGSGKGTFLVQQAGLEPGVNFIGIEYANAFYKYAADRCRRHAFDNVRMVHTEAGYFIRHFVPPLSLRQVHIYFPDPWPKKRHNKRRFVQTATLELLHGLIEPGGCIKLATDHGDYFAWMEEHAAAVAHLYERLPFESPESAGEGELVGTNFERKYRREGRPFHAMRLLKLDAPN